MLSSSRPCSSIGLVDIALITISLLVTVSLLLFRRRRKFGIATTIDNLGCEPLQYPPTPSTRHWLYKHALLLQPKPGQPKKAFGQIYVNWMQKLQSKVVMFELPFVGRLIVVGDVQIAKHILRNSEAFPKSPSYRNIFPLIGKKSIVFVKGKEWSKQRRLYNPGFSPGFLRNIVDTIVRKCDRCIARCDEDVKRGASTHVLDRMVDLTSDVIAQVAFGEDWDSTGIRGDGGDNRTLRTMRDLTAILGEGMYLPWRRWRRAWKTWRLSSALDRDMRRIVRRRLDALDHRADDEPDDDPRPAKRKDILSLTLSSMKRPMTRNDVETVTSQLKTFYFAGHDTTATTIAWAFWLLAQHPDSLRRAREEVAERLGASWVEAAARGNFRGLQETTYEALQGCTYLDAVSRETLRLYPPAATTRHCVDSKAGCGGYLLGNSLVHISVYAIQRDPDVWEDPDDFVPERFLGEDGAKRAASFSFLSFSKGARDCIGKYFAMIEIKIALAAMITRYDGAAVDEDEVYTTRITSFPIGGCRAKLQLRR